MNTKIYTINYQRTNGRPGWTSVWASNVRDAVNVVAERPTVAVVVKAVPNA